MSAVQVMAQSGVGGAADRTPFFGIKAPQELKKLVQVSKTLDAAIFKKIVKCEGHLGHVITILFLLHDNICRCDRVHRDWVQF